ncbi:hypothetical protein DH2020_030029 [Rehmannia glutinosa]|uniref:NB-ARC domain-containing protein n=1 Tax=Rehmannia glutinosa TaxID=99300 RepID=A0ABR0VR35_REHGL
MAYAALVSLAQTIHHILNHHQYSISIHEKQQIISLDKYIILLQAFLEDFPEEAKNLEGRIGDVAYEAEDVIECFISEQIAPCSAHHGHNLHGLKNVTHEIESIACEDFHELKKVRKEIASIVGKAMDIEKSFRIENVRPDDFYVASSSSRISPTTKNDDMVGFDDDLIEIKTLLCGESSKLQVIPIVGMGGIGKTTLARNAYDDPLITENFQIRVWVTVSQDYNAQEILSSLLVSMKERFDQSNDSKKEKVYKGLKGRRYLIVMDDIWSTKVWDDVRKIFPDDHNGSRVMLTTRLSDVAAYAGSSSLLHEMRFMDEDQSWNLLRQKVFKLECFPRDLEEIGKEIARSCRGLPLAVVLIAGLLSTIKTTRASWEEIAKNVNSVVATKDGQFEKILSLSYTHLPHRLRPCFLYMGGFPEDHKINVSKLIKLWVSEGFLKRPIVPKSIEDVAEEYLEDLVKRSLVLVTKRKSSGKIKSCSLHDLVRDLCIRQAHDEKFHRHVRNGYVGKTILERIKNERRLSISNSYLDCYASIDASTIRTIVCFKRGGASLGSLRSFRLLRVFDVVDGNVNSLPDQVFELFHLRYLAFDCQIKIPKTISNLENLETLIIHPRKKWGSNLPCFVSLPSEIWRLPKLRHLVCFYFDVLPNPGSSFGLENLQTLSAVKNLRCTKRILKMIPNLKKLGIFYSGDKYSPRLYNLVSLHQLEKLKIVVGPQIMHGFNAIFPRTLKKLTLSGLRLPWKDMTTSVGSLPNLEVLKLRNFACKGGEWETCEGGFVRLKYLLIDQSDLRDWITDSSHFPSLKCILFRRCWDLSEIPDGVGEIATLERIEVHFCYKSLAESARRIQEEQQGWGNDVLKVESG